MMRRTFYLLLAVLGSSCATHSGIFSSNSIDLTGEKTYDDIAFGYSRASYFLGIGGNSKELLIEEAKRNIIASIPDNQSVSIENITVEMKKTTFFPYSQLEVFMTGDVIDHSGESRASFSENYIKFLNLNSTSPDSIFKIGDIVLLKSESGLSKVKVVGFLPEKILTVHTGEYGSIRVKKYWSNLLFRLDGANDIPGNPGIVAGDSISFNYVGEGGVRKTGKAEALGVNKKGVLIKTSMGYKVLPFWKVEK